MTDNEVEDKPFPKFKHWNKYVQIVFVGLLVGAGLFGIYAVSLGIMNMTETPVILSTQQLGDYPLNAEARYYNNGMRTELFIYNIGIWDAQNVWIGTDDEYDAFMNNKLMSDTQHSFKGPFNLPKMVRYTIPLKVEPLNDKDKILSEMFKNGKEILIVVDGVKTHYSVVTTGEKEKTVVSVTNV